MILANAHMMWNIIKQLHMLWPQLTNELIVHGPVPSGRVKDLKYQLVGRINVNSKLLYDNSTKRVAYRINLWHFYFDNDIFHTLRMSR